MIKIERVCIDQTVFISPGLNIRIGTDGYSPINPNFQCPKITHIIKEILLYLIIIFKFLVWIKIRFQHIWHKRRIFHILMHIFHLFLSYFSHTYGHTHLSWTTLIIFIWSNTIIINVIVLRCIFRENNAFVNPSITSRFQLAIILHILFLVFGLGKEKKMRDKKLAVSMVNYHEESQKKTYQ